MGKYRFISIFIIYCLYLLPLQFYTTGSVPADSVFGGFGIRCPGFGVGIGGFGGSGIGAGATIYANPRNVTPANPRNTPSPSVKSNSNLGLQVNQEIMKTRTVVDNLSVQQYVNSIGQNLAFNSGRPDIPFTFTVIKDPDINAFASPGGYIYVTTGMLKFLSNESELAAVLSHEIGHIVAGHHIKQALAELGLNVGFDYLGQLLNYNPQSTIPQLTQMVILQKFSRTEETQADEIGTSIMARAGYSPLGMVQLLQGLQTIEQRGFLSNFLAAHPSSQARIEDVKKYIQANNLNQPGLAIDTPTFHEIVNSL